MMSTLRKAIFAAAAVAVTFGTMAATSQADAGYRFKFNHGHHFVIKHKPSCWLPVWNGYYVVKKKFYGPICYKNNHVVY